MKEYRSPGGERKIWYEKTEIDDIMVDTLEKAGLLPDASSDDLTVDVESLVEQHLGLSFDQHAELDDDVLGITHFVPGEKPRIEINRNLTGAALDNEDAVLGMIGRWRATVAHEVGHVLLHRSLYEIDAMQRGLFSSRSPEHEVSEGLMRCLKRDVNYHGGSDWREVQANMAIGALLMPKPLVARVVAAEMGKIGIGKQAVDPAPLNIERLVSILAQRFTVSKQAAHIRIESTGLIDQHGQALL